MAVFASGAARGRRGRAVPRRAELRQGIEGLNRELQRDWVDLAMSTGINPARWWRRSDVGDALGSATPSTSPPLEQAAAPGEVRWGEPTWRLVRDAVTSSRSLRSP